jgi:hypothetical protein
MCLFLLLEFIDNRLQLVEARVPHLAVPLHRRHLLLRSAEGGPLGAGCVTVFYGYASGPTTTGNVGFN